MDNYSNIGKAVLLRAIGLQKNHTVFEKVDNQDICIECPYKDLFSKANRDCVQCESCDHKSEMQHVKKYINEKNKYGYAHKLGTNAIKLLLSYHTLHPDKNGILLNVDIRKQAKLLNCNLKTVKACNNKLLEYGYISYSKVDTYAINILLPEYKDYYKPATEGGRGFFVMSKELFLELLKINSLVMLRIEIRQLVELDNMSIKGVFNVIEKSYRDMRLALPNYCKPNVIKSITETTQSDIFNVQIKDTGMRFVIKDEYNAKKHKSDQENTYLQVLKEFLNDFNQQIISINNENYSLDDFTWKEFLDHSEDSPSEYMVMAFNDLELHDMAQLSIQYSFDKVIEALSLIYKDYKLRLKKITNLGGLLRTIIIESYKELDKAA